MNEEPFANCLPFFWAAQVAATAQAAAQVVPHRRRFAEEGAGGQVQH